MINSGDISAEEASIARLTDAITRQLPCAVSGSSAMTGEFFAQNNRIATKLLGEETEQLTYESPAGYKTIDEAYQAFLTALPQTSKFRQISDPYSYACLSAIARQSGIHYAISYYGPSKKYPVASHFHIACFGYCYETAHEARAEEKAGYKAVKTTEYSPIKFKTKKAALASLKDYVPSAEHVVCAVKYKSSWRISTTYWKHLPHITVVQSLKSNAKQPKIIVNIRRLRDHKDLVGLHPKIIWGASKTFKYFASALKLKNQKTKTGYTDCFVEKTKDGFKVRYPYCEALKGIVRTTYAEKKYIAHRMAEPLISKKEQLNLNFGLFLNREIVPEDEGSGIRM